MTRQELERVRKWTNDKLATGQEPPWAWYQYMKLRETLDAILAGMAATTTQLPEDLPQSEQRPDRRLRLAVDNDPQGTAQHRSGEISVPLPM